MSSAAACASARRKRAGGQPNEIKQTKELNTNVKEDISKPGVKYTPIQLLSIHNDKIKDIESKLELISNVNNLNTNENNTNENNTNTNITSCDVNLEIEKINKNMDKINEDINSLKDNLIKNYNIYLEATKSIILLQNKVGEFESKLDMLLNDNIGLENDDNDIILKKLMNDISIEADKNLTIDTSFNNKLTETDFINIKNEVFNELIRPDELEKSDNLVDSSIELSHDIPDTSSS